MTKKEPEKKDLNKQEVRAALHPQRGSSGRGRSKSEKRESYSKYYKNKKLAIELESRNFQHLVLFPASDIDINKETKFYNMGGNSAIIYVHEIAPRLKRKATLRRDLDICDEDEKFRTGVCSIADLAGLETRLASIGVDRVEYKGDLVVFKLAREYSKDEIKTMLKLEKQRLETLNSLLYSKVVFPDVHHKILELMRIIPNKVKKMDKTFRDMLGMGMINALMSLIKKYSQMTHGDVEITSTLQQMILECDTLIATVSVMNEMKVWEIDACLRTGETIIELRRLLQGYYKEYSNQ